MKTLIINLPDSWEGVVEYFKEFYKKRTHYYKFDVNKTCQCWLAHNIYLKSESVCVTSADIVLPFEMELMIYHDYESLIEEDSRLKAFNYYLDFINLKQYKLSFNIDIKIVYNILVITNHE